MVEALLLIVRWLHAMAAVAWVGGGIFYWFVVRPAIENDLAVIGSSGFGPRFRQLVLLAMWMLTISGIVLTLDRLSAETATPTYFAVLMFKVTVAGWMFAIVWGRGRGAPVRRPAGEGRLRTVVGALTNVNAVLVLGPVVFFASDLLRLLVERGLAS